MFDFVLQSVQPVFEQKKGEEKRQIGVTVTAVTSNGSFIRLHIDDPECFDESAIIGGRFVTIAKGEDE